MLRSSRTSGVSTITLRACASRVSICASPVTPGLSLMRRAATYGGHLELSAFAHMTKRNVKVIQPGLVYVIEWDAGGDLGDDDSGVDDRERRRRGRDKRRDTEDAEPSAATGTAYVAYVSLLSCGGLAVDSAVATTTGNTFPRLEISGVHIPDSPTSWKRLLQTDPALRRRSRRSLCRSQRRRRRRLSLLGHRRSKPP